MEVDTDIQEKYIQEDLDPGRASEKLKDKVWGAEPAC